MRSAIKKYFPGISEEIDVRYNIPLEYTSLYLLNLLPMVISLLEKAIAC